MQYCTKCKAACDDALQKCPNCKSQRHMRQITPEDMVYLHLVEQYTAGLLEERFEQDNITYEMKPIGDGSWVSYTYDSEVMPTDKTVYVAYKDLDESKRIADEIRAKIDEENKIDEEFEDMNPRKRIFVQIVSIILLLIVVALVVLGADALANTLKEFFAGLKG